MKLLFFDDFRLGVLKGDTVVDVMDAVEDIPHVGPHDMINGVIEHWGKYKSLIEAAAAKGSGKPVSSVRIRPPLPRPINIDCMAVNYMENGTLPKAPQINAFAKSPTAVIGDGDTMILQDIPATIFEGEAEVALVIGKSGIDIPESEAMSYVFGYVNFIDGSARGLASGGFHQMKSRDTYAPIGPYIVTADEVPNPQKLHIQLWNNGKLMQDFNSDDMAHKIPECISWMSHTHRLEPGDILATGTNHRGLNPFMDGDKIELEVEGLGRLHINVRDDLKRTWARETRLDRQQQKLDGPTPQITGKHTPAK